MDGRLAGVEAVTMAAAGDNMLTPAFLCLFHVPTVKNL
jgi:hypothetical protein